MVTSYHPAAATAWYWLQHCDNLEQELDFRNKFMSSLVGSHPGVRAALAGGGPASEINYLSWNAAEALKLVSFDIIKKFLFFNSRLLVIFKTKDIMRFLCT